jgi:hypothetical protein
MRSERAVDGEEPQPLDLTLREQHPIEGIAKKGLHAPWLLDRRVAAARLLKRKKMISH